MKQFQYISLLAFGILFFISCQKKIESLQADPNNPTSVPPSLILGTVLTDISGTGSAGSLGGIN
ncbi:MAG: SusD/RagB family nutrient-binding outer membrane lipoprotein, partial [Bacteroidota bacterium]|nr:SusD/RagB family nutrient-binding outer membrane lipoprotein [Bacteroidota bacterium]